MPLRRFLKAAAWGTAVTFGFALVIDASIIQWVRQTVGLAVGAVVWRFATHEAWGIVVDVLADASAFAFVGLPGVLVAALIAVRRPMFTETRCRRCGYILHGITEPRCPECGERI